MLVLVLSFFRQAAIVSLDLRHDPRKFVVIDCAVPVRVDGTHHVVHHEIGRLVPQGVCHHCLDFVLVQDGVPVEIEFLKAQLQVGIKVGIVFAFGRQLQPPSLGGVPHDQVNNGNEIVVPRKGSLLLEAFPNGHEGLDPAESIEEIPRQGHPQRCLFRGWVGICSCSCVGVVGVGSNVAFRFLLRPIEIVVHLQVAPPRNVSHTGLDPGFQSRAGITNGLVQLAARHFDHHNLGGKGELLLELRVAHGGVVVDRIALDDGAVEQRHVAFLQFLLDHLAKDASHGRLLEAGPLRGKERAVWERDDGIGLDDDLVLQGPNDRHVLVDDLLGTGRRLVLG
mmetsp:Transcript_5334/g.13136  ORF Transcript_5334/g.13136 Transcript_5334/m.13136 type:complete len:337 (-) Transcript_5334:94-1104(-)